MHESWVATYQQLLELEYNKARDHLTEPPTSDSFLTDDEVKSVCQRYGVEFKEFIDSGLLVQYPALGWRTMHFDLIYRLIYIRNLERQRPIPLEYRIELHQEPVPDFGRHSFREVLPKLIRNEVALQVILSALDKWKYRGLSSHQLPIVQELLSKTPRYRVAAIVAPTASGKTLAFFLPVIVKAVERSIEGKAGISSILVYPRKALERDQLQSFLTIVDSVNKGKGRPITIGIDDGDTKRFDEIRDGETYREMKCVDCSNALIIEKKECVTTVRCGRCSKEYPYLLASKDEIWQKKPMILITNVHTIYRRLLTPSTVKMFVGIDYLVFDEAHVYTDYLGGHVFHIIKLLRHAACSNGSSPYFIFSSATIPNPHDFIARLAGCEADELFYVDYRKTLEKTQGTGKRLMLYLYLLPHPDSSVETLTEALVLAVTLWCHRHNLKAITFVDSVAEISTLSDYIHTTILEKREGREVTDHLYSTRNAPDNSYNWSPLAPHSEARDEHTFKRFVLNRYKESIGIHYGQLPLPERAKVEYHFSEGLLKLLLSTSTLELGIDLSDVAAIIQHKLPITPEGVVQRVGRSGRSPACLRVALGIIALQSSPLSTLYMFDEVLRGRLADPSLLPLAQVGQASASIKLQHTLSLVLYKRALEGKPTFIASEEYLRSKQEVVNAVKEIVNELNDDLVAFNAKVDLFDGGTLLRSQINELRFLLSPIVNSVGAADQADFTQDKEKWEEILSRIEENARAIQHTLQRIGELKTMFERIQVHGALDVKVLNDLESLRNLLRRAYDLCRGLLKAARSSYLAGDGGLLQRWDKANYSDAEEMANVTPDSDEILNRLHPPLLKCLNTTKKDVYKAFREKFGFGFDHVFNTLTDITKNLGSRTEKGIARFLRELPNEAKFLVSVNLPGLTAYESLRRIESELKVNPWGINIFDALNLLLLNRRRFSLMLEPPSPELRLAGVEEA